MEVEEEVLGTSEPMGGIFSVCCHRIACLLTLYARLLVIAICASENDGSNQVTGFGSSRPRFKG